MLIHHEAGQLGIDEGGELHAVLFDLLRGQVHGAVEGGVGLVYQLEKGLEQREIVQPCAHPQGVQLLPVLHIVGELPPPVKDFFILGRGDEIFHPVHILHIAQGRHVLHIVGVIIVGEEAAPAVKALHQHSLPVHVREAQGAVYGGAAQLPGPVFHGFKEGPGDLRVVDEVHLGEAQTVGAPLVVRLAAQNGADAPHDFTLPQGQPAAGLAVGKGGVFLSVPVVQVVAVGGGNELRYILI